jgi:hypothetical protein
LIEMAPGNSERPAAPVLIPLRDVAAERLLNGAYP